MYIKWFVSEIISINELLTKKILINRHGRFVEWNELVNLMLANHKARRGTMIYLEPYMPSVDVPEERNEKNEEEEKI